MRDKDQRVRNKDNAKGRIKMTVSHGNEMKSKTWQTRTTNGVVEMVKIHGNDNEVEYKTIKAN